jgi:hypothetical protein
MIEIILLWFRIVIKFSKYCIGYYSKDNWLNKKISLNPN